MFLKQLTLNGFKAFANKTILKFEEGICGITGSNGCGKSNIVDAIKWVSGEQKISDIRGNSMEDVIFNGTDSVSPSNMAEVELLIANEKNELPLDFDEILVTRRYYRSGESEYLINKSKCRLKDIQNLFLESGIGKNSSAIMEQEKTKKIISQNPEDLRTVFEEAANILKYRDKKKEYQRKIEKTQENLRISKQKCNDLERRHTVLKQQVDQSRKYFDINELLKKEEIHLLVYEVIQFRKKESNFIQKIKTTETVIKTHQENIELSNNDLKKIQAQINNSKESISLFEKNKIKLQTYISSLKKEREIHSESLLEIDHRLKERKNEITQFDREKQEIKKNIEKLNYELKNGKEEQNQIKKDIEKIKVLSSGVLKKQEEHLKNLEKFKSRTQEIQVEKKKLNKRHIVVVEKLVNEIDELKQKISQNEKNYIEKKELVVEQKKQLMDSFAKFSPHPDEENLQIAINEIDGEEQSEVKQKLKVKLKELFQIKELAKAMDKNIAYLLNTENPFYDLIFNTQGTYAEKEKIDRQLETLEEESKLCEKRIQLLETEVQKCTQEYSEFKRKINELEIEDIKLNQTMELQSKIKEEKIANLNGLEIRYTNALQYLTKQKERIKEISEKINQNKKEEIESQKEFDKIDTEMSSSNKTIKGFADKLNKINIKKIKFEEILQTRRAKLAGLNQELALIKREIEYLYQTGETKHSENLLKYEKEIVNIEFNPQKIKEKIEKLTQNLKALGSPNPLAESEYKLVDEELNELLKQIQDIEKSMEDLVNIVREIDENSSEIFLDTFRKIQKNFHHIFRRLFEGGKAKLELTDEKNPLTCGIDIKVQPPGKKFVGISYQSGGEKSLIAVSLILSIFLVKPAPICVLDEVDAALDGGNIKRVADLLTEFKEKTQFLIITHNQNTVRIFDYMFGVAMRNKSGISEVYSLRL